jgi:inorganic pyrophosphatase
MQIRMKNLGFVLSTFLVVAGSAIAGQNYFIKQRNIVFEIPNSPKLRSNELFFLAEISKGSAKKHELRTASGQLILDRTICPRTVKGTERVIKEYPVTYGITPGRFNVDGDPLDLIVLGSESKYEQQIAKGQLHPEKVRVVGLMKMEECDKTPCGENQWKQDYKVVAVDPSDKRYEQIETATDIPETLRTQYIEFFSNYKGYDGENPLTRVTGFGDRQEAERFIKDNFAVLDPMARAQEIDQCQVLFRTRLADLPQMIEKDEAYLTCLQRVHYEGFLPDSPTFEFFLKFNAAQRALALGETGVTLDNAIEKLDARKKQKKSHFRFVTLDRPSPPGTGNPIYEWVETKNRNKGCSPDFPAQHYESRPIVDMD